MGFSLSPTVMKSLLIGTLLSFSAALAQDAICGNGETELSVVINDGDTFNYKTSKKGKYSNNMDCFVYYELGESCEEMTLSCNKINIKNNKACTNGDTLLITNDEGEEKKDDVDDEEKELEEGIADQVVTDGEDGEEYTEMPLDDQNNDDVLAKPEENNFIETSDNESIAENNLEAEEEKIEEEYDEDNRREESGFNMVYERSSSSAFEAGVDY